jgi:hypothetical protein
MKVRQARGGGRGLVPHLVALLVVMSGSAALALDLRALADFVAPAYTALNYTVVCAQEDRDFLSHTSGPRGSGVHYAEHVKDEAIASLSHADSVRVLTAAADEARASTLRKLRELTASAAESEARARVKAWCESDARLFVREFIDRHEGDHGAIEEWLRRAKRGA